MKKLVIGIVILVIVIGSASGQNYSTRWQTALEQARQAHEYFEEAYEELQEILNFRYTDTSDLEGSKNQASWMRARCATVINDFESAIRAYNIAIHHWETIIEHRNPSYDDRRRARDNIALSEEGVRGAENNIAILEEREEFFEEQVRYANILIQQREEEERIGRETGLARANTYPTPGYSHPDWGSSMQEVLNFEDTDDCFVGDYFIAFPREVDTPTYGNMKILWVYFFKEDKLVRVSYFYEFETVEYLHRYGFDKYQVFNYYYGQGSREYDTTLARSNNGTYIVWDNVDMQSFPNGSLQPYLYFSFDHPYWSSVGYGLLPEEYRFYPYNRFRRLIDSQ
jgi:tetratricopeptide (TPR) repeat protein